MANKKKSQTKKNLAKLRRKLGKKREEKQAAKAIGVPDENNYTGFVSLLLYKNNIGDNQILARLAELKTQLEQEGARRNGFETYLHGYVAELERNTAQLRFRLLANFINIVELLGRERLQLTVYMLDIVASRLAEATDIEISEIKLNIAVKKINIYLFKVRTQIEIFVESTKDDCYNIVDLINNIQGLLPQPVANTADKDIVNRLFDNIIRLKGDIVELLGGVEEKLGISTNTVAVRRDNIKGLRPASKSKGNSSKKSKIHTGFLAAGRL